MTRHDWDEASAALLDLAALLEECVRDLAAITEETARLRKENAQLRKELADFQAVVDELSGWAAARGGLLERPERSTASGSILEQVSAVRVTPFPPWPSRRKKQLDS